MNTSTKQDQMSSRIQNRNTRIVTSLLNSSCGDLILDNRGNLCVRNTYNDDWTKELPWNSQTPGEKLATISRFGWTLTRYGAQYILENSIFEKSDLKFLNSIVERD